MPLEQPPPLLVGLAPSIGLRLGPATSLARAICSVTALRDHAFQPHPLGSAQELGAVIESVGEAQPAVTGTHDEDHEQVLALDARQLAHVPAVVEQQIEGPHGDVFIGSGAEVQRVEVEQAEWVECGHLPVDNAGPCRDSRNRASQCFEARGAVVSALRIEPHKAAVLVQLDAPAIELPDYPNISARVPG